MTGRVSPWHKTKMLDNGLKVSKFKLQSHYYVQFQTNTFGEGMNPPYPSMLDCSLKVSKFKLQSHYYVQFQTNTFGEGMNPLIPLC